MKITVNDVSLYYEIIGAGQPLIMLHGNGEDHTLFNKAAAILSEHFTSHPVGAHKADCGIHSERRAKDPGWRDARKLHRAQREDCADHPGEYHYWWEEHG